MCQHSLTREPEKSPLIALLHVWQIAKHNYMKSIYIEFNKILRSYITVNSNKQNPSKEVTWHASEFGNYRQLRSNQAEKNSLVYERVSSI